MSYFLLYSRQQQFFHESTSSPFHEQFSLTFPVVFGNFHLYATKLLVSCIIRSNINKSSEQSLKNSTTTKKWLSEGLADKSLLRLLTSGSLNVCHLITHSKQGWKGQNERKDDRGLFGFLSQLNTKAYRFEQPKTWSLLVLLDLFSY